MERDCRLSEPEVCVSGLMGIALVRADETDLEMGVVTPVQQSECA